MTRLFSRRIRSPLPLALVALWLLPSAPALAQAPQEALLHTATQVLQELRSEPDQGIPNWLLQRAYGIAVIPDVIKGAFFIGGRYGTGVLTVRNNTTDRFSDPIFIRLAGGSFGWQIGATSTDVVLVFVTPRGVDNFSRGKFTLGADASVAAGPLGRQGEAAAGVSAEVYSYSRSRGLFAGVALDGTALSFDTGANRAFYGTNDVTSAGIISGRVSSASPAAAGFLQMIATSTNSPGPLAPGAAAPSAPPSPAAPPAAPASGAGAASGGTQAFPLPDANPGSEPKQQQ